MSIIVWMILGIACGFVARRLTEKSAVALIIDEIFGVSGALVGGLVSCHLFGGDSVSSFDVTSLLMATAGAIVALLVFHLLLHRRTV